MGQEVSAARACTESQPAAGAKGKKGKRESQDGAQGDAKKRKVAQVRTQCPVSSAAAFTRLTAVTA